MIFVSIFIVVVFFSITSFAMSSESGFSYYFLKAFQYFSLFVCAIVALMGLKYRFKGGKWKVVVNKDRFYWHTPYGKKSIIDIELNQIEEMTVTPPWQGEGEYSYAIKLINGNNYNLNFTNSGIKMAAVMSALEYYGVKSRWIPSK